ncbi:WD40 repeat domain-containing protein, partial [Streptomyces sp. Ncost-T10-10d]|uniref:WD40 repeat domain-containing protein n=1 Tax=Streptomyces sp. Ncost-T10-10d TaxID=1839774 RepID=UPI00081F6A8D
MEAGTVPIMSDDLRSNNLCHEDAVAGGWLADPEWLVNTDPERVMAVLDSALGPEELLAAAVYRASAHLHQGAESWVRQQLLGLDAARYGDVALSARIAAVPAAGKPTAPWGVEWATGGLVSSQFRHALTGHIDFVQAVATTSMDGRPVAVTGSWDSTVRVWDLASGKQIGEPLTGHTGTVCAVATTVLDGRPIAVSGGDDDTARVWDLTTGKQIGEPLTGHAHPVWAVATAMVDGRPVAVTGSCDKKVRMWDLTTRQPIGKPLTGHTNDVWAV